MFRDYAPRAQVFREAALALPGAHAVDGSFSEPDQARP
jgi:hypothetical protein